jgi:hypothetical protein
LKVLSFQGVVYVLAHVLAAQQALFHRARCNRAARCSEYNAAMKRT